MIYKNYILLLCVVFFLFGSRPQSKVPVGFVDAKTIIPDLDVELRYYTDHNFVGDTIDGYHANRLFITKASALQLKKVQEELQSQNLCLRVYDGYRPQRAVNHFVRWAKQVNDTVSKSEFYPNVNKRHLFKLGYIASKSGHSRGSTLDLTIIDGETNIPLDMGSPYDFFGEVSWVNHPNLTESQKKNRQLLQTMMNKQGFRSYSKEWWHFTLRGEPFPKTYFDFPIQ